jgi:hypothetical protein
MFSGNNLNAFPKRDVVFDFLCCVFRFGVKPNRVFVCFAASRDIIITRRAFPAANCMRFARAEIFFVY